MLHFALFVLLSTKLPAIQFVPIRGQRGECFAITTLFLEGAQHWHRGMPALTAPAQSLCSLRDASIWLCHPLESCLAQNNAFQEHKKMCFGQNNWSFQKTRKFSLQSQRLDFKRSIIILLFYFL